jgi:hypothetical protein
VQLAQLVHRRRSQVGAAVAAQLGPDSQAAFAVAVSEAQVPNATMISSTCLLRSAGRLFRNDA